MASLASTATKLAAATNTNIRTATRWLRREPVWEKHEEQFSRVAPSLGISRLDRAEVLPLPPPPRAA